MTPDRVIVKKVKAYDPDLFIKWNAAKEWFELWRKVPFKPPMLITTVTQNVYDSKRPRTFCQLDERLLWWIYEADSFRLGPKYHVLSVDSRFMEWQKKCDRQKMSMYRDLAKDIWQAGNNFFMDGSRAKNGKPKFEGSRERRKFLKPDCQKLTSPRLFSRSKQNAIQYDFKRKI